MLWNAIQSIASVPGDERIITLTVRASAESKLEIEVRDTGGLAEESLKRLFEAFFTPKSHGMGMGLAICRSIVEAHGGQMSARPNDGPGATVGFTLPRHCEA